MLIKKMSVIHRRVYVAHNSLLCTYKAFVRPHLNYADIIYDQFYQEAHLYKHSCDYDINEKNKGPKI